MDVSKELKSVFLDVEKVSEKQFILHSHTALPEHKVIVIDKELYGFLPMPGCHALLKKELPVSRIIAAWDKGFETTYLYV